MKIEWKWFMNGDFVRMNFPEDIIPDGVIFYSCDMIEFKKADKNAEQFFYNENIKIAKRMLKYY